MTSVAIELIDAGILALGDDGLETEASPGFALLDGKELLVGAEAQAIARLKPRWVDHRFWDRLDTSPMPRPFPRAMSRADVAHAHLKRFWGSLATEPRPRSVLLVAPGSFSSEQLGLAVGVARACEMPVSGLVDAAVAATSRSPIGSRMLHLDLLLHRAIWTELEHDGELVRRRVQVIDDSGLVALRNLWARRIAEIMVRQTRFDPLHHGRAEQTLFDRLPGWLAELAAGSRVEVSLTAADKVHTVEILADSAATVAGPILRPVIELGRVLAAEGQLPSLFVSERAAAIPGFLQELARLPNRDLRVLAAGSGAKGALHHRESIESTGEELRLVTRLPAELQTAARRDEAAVRSAVPRSAPRSAVAPSHLLVADTAHPIDSEPLWLGTSISGQGRGLVVADAVPGLSRRHCAVRRRADEVIVEDHSSYGTFVNDRRIRGEAVVAVGDRLRLGTPGVELLLIRVEDDV